MSLIQEAAKLYNRKFNGLVTEYWGSAESGNDTEISDLELVTDHEVVKKAELTVKKGGIQVKKTLEVSVREEQL